MRKNRFFLLLLFLVLVNFMGSCSRSESEEIKFPVFGETESILDRRVHLEPQLITEIPQVPRWCDLLPLKKRMVDIGDVRLYVEEEGRGRPLVLLHGGPGATHHYFHPWFSLAKKFARLIYYDQRGCGLSEFKPGPEGYSVFQAVDDLEALRKALGIDKWVVLGHSYGGFLAQFYTLVYPEHVAGLILVGSSLGMPVDTGRSRQLDYLSSEEKKRLGEIRIELRKYFQQHQLSYRK
ncbi:MAG TPA: alpha/beta fold hydrolase, partial [Candidatus Aminicenantes bacterium]|nr:alpha/beta fold hydrolase [Candidatus Aminicenantes bacterium]